MFFARALSVGLVTIAVAGPAHAAKPPSDPVAIFDAVVAKTRAEFHDPKIVRAAGKDSFAETAKESRRRLTPRSDRETLHRTLNELLAQLGTSHTGFLLSDDFEYWAVKSAFAPRVKDARVVQCGASFVRRGAHYVVSEVFAGTPAAAAGLQRGDQVITAGFTPMRGCQPGRGKRKNEVVKEVVKEVVLDVRRLPWEKPKVVRFQAVDASVAELLLEDARLSARLYKPGGKSVAYFHLTAGTHPEFLRAMQAALDRFQAEADAFVLDLRGGLGGATPAYLRPFLAAAGTETTGDGAAAATTFSKPLVALVDGTTFGGKEVLAWLLKHQRGAKLVGAPTAGQLMAGAVFEIVPGDALLYLAVGKPEGLAGKLEGIGVAPDVRVDDPLVFAAGADPILQRGVDVAAAMAAAQ